MPACGRVGAPAGRLRLLRQIGDELIPGVEQWGWFRTLMVYTLYIHPAPEAPHGATADFDLVHFRQGQETLRERWSITLRFTFLTVIPSQLVVYNPMGILITYLQADRALVTEAPR